MTVQVRGTWVEAGRSTGVMERLVIIVFYRMYMQVKCQPILTLKHVYFIVCVSFLNKKVKGIF